MPSPASLNACGMKLFAYLHRLPPSLRQPLLSHLTFQRPRPFISSKRLSSILTPVSRRDASTTHRPPSHSQQDEVLVPPPTSSSGPLLTRLPNRALPDITPGLSAATKTWLKTLPIFLLLCAIGSLSIFNYQKSSSSTVSSILYALRTSPAVRDLLGDEIYFNNKIPWISGELNQLHGLIDISFWVKGTKAKGLVRFVSVRKKRDGYFETLEWSLTTEDGTTVQLLEVEGQEIRWVSERVW